MEFLAECYANKFVAEELSRMLSKELKQPSKVRHSYKQGRDRIIKEITSNSKEKEHLIIAVIDYEKGISRIYVNRNFELLRIDEHVLIGINKRRNNIIAIVFDPNIEEAFICRIRRELCRDIFQLQRLKSEKAHSIVKKLINTNDAMIILQAIAKKLTEIIQHIKTSSKETLD